MSLFMSGNTDFWCNDPFTRTGQPAPGNKTFGADRASFSLHFGIKKGPRRRQSSTRKPSTLSWNRFTMVSACGIAEVHQEANYMTARARSYYQILVTHAQVPDMNTVDDAALWAGRLATGETARLTDGGAPLAWPAIGEVNTASAACAAAAAQSSAKSGFDIAQEDVGDQRLTVDPVIKDLWDTIEYNLRADAPPSLRRIAREWGVVYDGEEEAPAPPPVPPTP